jgi:hypothetical protein
MSIDEADELSWTRPMQCSAGACVEIAMTENAVFVRNSATPKAPIVSFTQVEWSSFVQAIRQGQFTGMSAE